MHTGNGTAWFDDLQIELDGKAYDESSAFDLTFESTRPRGFYTGGNGYRIGLDQDVAHGGQQSLRMQFDESSVATPESDPKAVAAQWEDVIKRLQALDVSGKEWAI